jgi:hypothetical protein
MIGRDWQKGFGGTADENGCFQNERPMTLATLGSNIMQLYD